jgi:hypothetical protein
MGQATPNYRSWQNHYFPYADATQKSISRQFCISNLPFGHYGGSKRWFKTRWSRPPRALPHKRVAAAHKAAPRIRGVVADVRARHAQSVNKARVLTVLFSLSGCSAAQAVSLETPFDFSRSVIGLEVSIEGKPLYAMLDTGVDPSLINLADAAALGLKIDRTDSGEASGFGEGRGVTVFPTRIEGMTIRGHRFAAFDALAADTAPFTGPGQRQIGAVLGYSFLSDKIVLVDYIDHELAIFDSSTKARAMVRTCRTRWRIPLKTFDSYPVIPGFRLGEASGHGRAMTFYGNCL